MALTHYLSFALFAVALASPAYSYPVQPDYICRVAGGGIGFNGCPLPIWRSNTFDTYNLNTGETSITYSETQLWGARIDPGAAVVPIHAFDKCYYLENHSKASLFVPFKTDQEWTAFLQNHPPQIRLTKCLLQAVYSSTKKTSQGDYAEFTIQGYSSTVVLSQTLSKSFSYSLPQACLSGPQAGANPCEWKEEIEVVFAAVPPMWQVRGEQVLIEQGGKPLKKPPIERE